MRDRTLIATGAIGAAFAGLCCMTPLLAAIARGLAEHLDRLERETLDASIQHSTPPVQTGSERTYPYKLAARHISSLASYVRRMGYGLDYLFAHARP
jgi:hypothetical protein